MYMNMYVKEDAPADLNKTNLKNQISLIKILLPE